MTRVPAVVIAGPGTNRDADARDALELAGADVTVLLASELIERPSLLSAARLAWWPADSATPTPSARAGCWPSTSASDWPTSSGRSSTPATR